MTIERIIDTLPAAALRELLEFHFEPVSDSVDLPALRRAVHHYYFWGPITAEQIRDTAEAIADEQE